MSACIYVSIRVEVRVELPEGVPSRWDGDDSTCPAKIRERAVEVALSAIRAHESGEILIDGEDEDGAEYYVEASDSDVEEVRAE